MLDIDPADLGPLFRDGRSTISCELSSTGAIDALRAVGTVAGPGYTAPVRFYDPHTATFPSLTAVGLESAAETHVTVHNVTDSPVEFTPVLREAALTDPLTQTLPSRTLAPHGSVEVDLEPILSVYRAKAIPLVTLTLKSATAKGSMVGAVTQISAQNGLVEDIPLRTSAPPAYDRGSYPLRWDGDYTNMVTVTNTTDEVLRIGGVITAGEMGYVLTRTDIGPGATIVLDVDKWRREGTPDINGKVMPKDAPYGKIHWIEMAGGTKAGLLGRTSLTSVANRRKSSFSCNNPCQYNYEQAPNFNASIFTTLPTNSSQISAVTEEITQVNGSNYEYPYAYSASYVSTTNSAIASTSAGTQSSNIRVNGNSAGTVTMSYEEFMTEYQPNYPAQSCSVVQSQEPETGTTTVGLQIAFSNVKDLSLAKAGAISAGTSNQITAIGSPAGGSFSWSTNNANVMLTNTSSNVVTTTAASVGAATITTTYTLNGESTSGNVKVNVFQPSSITSVADPPQTHVCYSGASQYNGPAHQITYQIQSTVNGASVPVTSDVYMAETFTLLPRNPSGPPSCGATPAISAFTTNQTFNDTLNYCSTNCLPARNQTPTGSCILQLEHVWTANGFPVFDHTLTYTCTNITPQ